MENRYKVPENYIKDNSKPIPPKHTVPINQANFRSVFFSLKAQIWSSYFLAMVISVVVTSIGLEKTGIAKNIMDYARYRQKMSEAALNSDGSLIQFYLDADMVVQVLAPQNERVGDTADGLRFKEIPVRFLESAESEPQSLKRLNDSRPWIMQIPNPPDGEYTLNFSCKSSNVYQTEITFVGSTSEKTKKFSQYLTCHENEYLSYKADYQKYKSNETELTFIKLIPVN